MRHYTVTEKTSMIILAVIGWFGLILQAILMISVTEETGLTTTETVIRFFSYFTILTNLLVTLSLTLPLVNRTSKLSRFFASYSTRTALLVYIITVGFIYMQILQKLWNPEGWSYIADRILHYFMPIAYLIFWIFAVPKKDLPFKKVFLWLIYPFIYLAFALTRGAVSGFYPYPFLDVQKHGFEQVLTNAGFITLIFVFLSCLFWLAGRFLK